MVSAPKAGAAERLAAIHERVAAACRRAGRDPASVTLLAASKTQPAAVLVPYLQAGLRLLGENRVQEAQAKQRDLAELAKLAEATELAETAELAATVDQAKAAGGPWRFSPADLEWHLIGPLQSNKVRPALDLFRCIHSIDRPEIAAAVDHEAARRGARLTGLLEINLGGEPSKHGFAVADLAASVRPLAALTHLRIVGLMAIPPPADAEPAARSWFKRLRELRDDLGGRPEWRGWPGLLSMGMSDDFEVAIEEGATHVRVGTALFGRRGAVAPPLSMLI